MGRRGVVVEIAPKNKVIVMTAQGEFIKVPFKKHVYVGQEIRCQQTQERLSLWQMGLAAVLFVALIGTWPLLTGQLISVPEAAAYVITLDVDPSLELRVSKEHKVLGVSGLNADGEHFVSRLSIVGQSLRPAMAEITGRLQREGYFRQGQHQVIVTVAALQEQDATLKELKNRRSGEHSELEQTILDAFSGVQLAQVRMWQVPPTLQAEAKTAGIIPSKYIAIQMPVTPVIPQRLEARLTMRDPVEPEPSVSTGAKPSVLQANAGQELPALTPTKWTTEPTSGLRAVQLYDLGLPIVSAKGDFQPYQ